MAANSPTDPTILEHREESSCAYTVADIDKALNKLAVKSGVKSRKGKPSLPSNNLSIHPTSYMTLQSPVFSPHALAAPPNNERSYLLENRQRQYERGERLANALHILEVRIDSAQTRGEARKLRKEAEVLRKRITESFKQEQLITLRLDDIQNEDFMRNPYWQAQSAGLLPYSAPWSPYSSLNPGNPMTLPVMSPIPGPVSPLTPLPPGLCHPSPIVPSPLTSPYWLGAQNPYQYSMMAKYVQTDLAYYLGADAQQPYVHEQFVAGLPPSRRQSLAPTATNSTETRHKTKKPVDCKPQQDGVYNGRRWSLAAEFSPTPRDKRMSMPGLETIWKGKVE